MMKNFKRILSVLLLLSMVLSMLPAVSLTASAATVTEGFTAAPAGTYTKTDASALKTGDTIILVYETDSVAMNTTQNNNRGQTAVTINSDSIVLASGNDVQGLVLQSSGNSSYPYLLYTGNGWLYAPSYASSTSKNNYLKTTDSNAADSGAFWKFGTDHIEAQGVDGARRFLQYNASNDIFSCYLSGNQKGIAFYKLTSSAGSGSGTTTGTLASGNYVIAALVDGKYYAMSNTYASKISGTEITVSNGSVSAANAEGYIHTVASTDSGYTISNGTQYLAYNSSTNLKTNTDPYYWTIEAGTKGSYRVNSATSGRGLVYSAGTTNKFGGYAISNITDTGDYYDIEFLPIEGGSTPVDPDVPVVPDDPEIDAVENGDYVIAAKVDDKYYAMSYDLSSGKLSSKVINVIDGYASIADAEGYIYTVIATGGGYTIYDGEEYVAYNSSTNLMKSEDPYIWQISTGTKGTYRFAASTDTGRGLVFRANDYNLFGGYALNNVTANNTQYFDIELLPIKVAGITDTFVKVTSNDMLGKGYYLIAYEENEGQARVFDSSLDNLNATNPYQTLTINGDKIVTSVDHAFQISFTDDDISKPAWIISSKAYYIGQPNSSNALVASQTLTMTNSISIDSDGNAEIIASSGDRVLRYYSTTSSAFRFYSTTLNNSNLKKIALYKSTSYVPGNGNVVVSWSETGAAEGVAAGTITATDENGKNIANYATVPAGTNLTMSFAPNGDYQVASVKVDGKSIVPDENGQVTFVVSRSTKIVVAWEEVIIVALKPSLKIVSGFGKIQVYRNGELIGSHEGGAAKNGVPLDQSVYEGEILKLVIKPGEGYRLTAVENGGQRVLRENLTWDATEEAYTCEIEVKGNSNVLRFSFLPRKTDIGVVAVLATTFTSGKYVITGTTFDPTQGNSFDTKETYLLFGCDDLLVDGQTDLIGDKAAALNLYDSGITIQTSTPYTMEGLTKGSLYDFQPYGDTGYYTIQICGMTGTYYLGAEKAKELQAIDEIGDESLWSVSVDQNGVATIINKKTECTLKFAAASNNDQFRVYNNTSTGFHLPVLFKATVTGYQVNYSKENLGSVTAYNSTTSTSVASGSIQNEHNTIVFSFTPAQYNTLESVTVNGVDVTDQVVNGRLTISNLSENITVHAVFSNIVISNDVYINYFVNGEWKDEVQLTDLSVFSIVPDLNLTLVIDGETYKYSDLTFEYSENVNTGAMYANPNDSIKIDDGHVINIYFLTSAIKLSKTAVQTTNTSNGTTNGGDDSNPNFSTDNGQDDHGNIKQTYEITLEAQSSNWAEGYTTGGETDIIVIVDNSLSMYYDTEDGSTTNKSVLLDSLQQFLNIVLERPEANNYVSLITYHTTAYLHGVNGTFRKTKNLDSDADTYAEVFMNDPEKIMELAKAAMVENDVDKSLNEEGGTTNPEAALKLAKQVAALRPDVENPNNPNNPRDLIIIMFTDGKPTSRLTDEFDYSWDGFYDSYGDWLGGGIYTSSKEFNEARDAGIDLKDFVKGYKHGEATIYSMALLNELEANGYEQNYYNLVKYLYGTDSDARQWTGSSKGNIIPYVSSSSYWKKNVGGFSDVYLPVYTSKVNIKTELKQLFESIAYTAVEGEYVTINGSVVDVIPPQFTLTEESREELEDAGWTVTVGPNGTTLTHPNFPATHVDADNHDEVSKVTYEIECVGGGYGSFFTNTYATFSYTDIKTNKPVSANFYKPTVEIIPWTVDDHGVASPKTDLVLDIIANDLFAEFTAGGYTIEDYKVILTDKDGNETTYLNAVEQNGDPSTYFDATLNQSNNTVTFYTETNGSYEFYYVVQATIVKPDGSKEIVYSRVTTVDVVTPNVNLNKTAQEVTNNSGYQSFVETDEYGNVQQLYLITLQVDKLSADDKIYNGILTDKIPADFEFVKFVTPTSNANLSHKDGVITWTNISATGSANSVATLQFLVRYTGKGYGSTYTNISANFSYNFMTSDGPQTTQHFPVPAAGLNPSTVNDLDIAHSGDTNTLNVLDNDLFDEDGFQLPNYPVGGVTVIITDADGNPVADPEDYYGMEITVNPGGTITYTAPEGEGPIQFYYVVESNVTLPLDSNYAEDNSTTLQSRPTMVTVYTITDKYLVVDFGYTTDGLSLLPNCGVIIDAAKGVTLKDCITFTTPSKSGIYGTASYATLESDVTFSYSPATMDFHTTDHFGTSLSTKKNTYVTVEREVAASVTVVPANNLFFEENFINFGTFTQNGDGNDKTQEGGGQGTWNEGAWVTEGTTDNGRTQGTDNKTYGYDNAYKTEEVYSGGSTKAVTVVPNQGDEGNMYGDECGYFTFTGTGFDIYATCSRDTGVLIAEVYAFNENEEYQMGNLQRVILIDTYMDGGEGVVFDQLPVIMCHDLDYDRYTVKLRAYYHPMFDHNYVKPEGRAVRNALGLSYDVPLEIQVLDTSKAKASTRSMPAAANGKYNVYVDSVRIYNPITEVPTEIIANKAYTDAKEINSNFTNIRDYILDAGDWTAGQSAVNGVLYIADQRAGKLNGGESGTVEDDNTVPAPEVSGVYLSPTGALKTVVENGKTYLLDENDNKASYNGCPVYIIYIADTESGQETYYVADNSIKVSRIGYRYDEDGTEKVLPVKALAELNIIHYTSQYEAFGPKYEVHLKNGGGIAFSILGQTYAQVSAKMADDGQAQIYAYYTKANKLDWYPVDTVTSRTEMYYDLSDCIEEGMLIIKCVSDDPNAILSLCNLKTSGDVGGTDIEPLVDGRTIVRAAFAFAGMGDALEEVETQVDEKITISQQLFLESDLTLTFRINESQLKGYDLSTAYLTVERDIYPTGLEMYVNTQNISEYEIKDGVVIFTYRGIAATQMNDEIRAVLHIKDAEGKEYVSPVLTTSVTYYAKRLLEIYGSSNPKLCTVIMDMLNYGTAAQMYFNRHTDAPANEAYPIFAQYASYASEDLAMGLEDLSEQIKNEGATATMSMGLDLATRIGISYAVNLPQGVSAEDATVVVRDADGIILKILSLADGTVDSQGRYVVNFYGNTTRQMRRVVYATVYVDGEIISDTYGYSISSYAAKISNYEGAPESIVALTKLMVMYGDASEAYFGD